jgi:hypothetical protein
MTAGYFFPYRKIPLYRNAAPTIHQAPSQQRSTGPTTYDADRHEVDCIISTCSPLHCRFGRQVLWVSRDAVDWSLLDEGRLPLLDEHDSRHVLGRVVDVWIENKNLCGTLRFDETPEGRRAEAMVARGELSGISCHAAAKQWIDEDGDNVSNTKLLNPHFDTWGRDGGPQTFTATRWVLNEVSLTACPRDRSAMVL